MNRLTKSGILALSLTVVFLLFTSVTSTVPAMTSSIRSNSLNTAISMEYVTLAAGHDTAVLGSVYTFGSSDGSGYPVDVNGAGFGDTIFWGMNYASTDGYSQYVNRPISDLPEGLIVFLWYGSPNDDAAEVAMSEVQTAFPGTYFPLWEGSGLYVYLSEDASYSTFLTALSAISNDGYAALFSSVRSDTPGYAQFGVERIPDENGIQQDVSFQAASFVKTDGITRNGDEFTMSTANVFGQDIVALNSPDFGLSRVQFTIPYPIAPVTNGISPFPTSNPLPHVTGQMLWDQRSPWYTPIGPNGNFAVTFTVGMDSAFPNVQNVLTIDQNKLNKEGILEAVFTLDNIGDATAKNILLSLPLGPDFGKIADQDIEIFKIRDQFTINEGFTSAYTILGTVDLPLVGLQEFINHPAFTITGWYEDFGTTNLAIWDDTTSLVLFSGVVAGSQVELTIESTAGFPAPFVTAVNTHLVGPLSTITATDEVAGIIRDNLAAVLTDTFNDSFHALYIGQDSFIPNYGDFALNQRVNPVTGVNEFFLEKEVLSLAPTDAPLELSFSISGIPIKTDRVAFMEFQVDESGPYPTATLTSKNENYNSVLQYVFTVFELDGRPLSFGLPDDFTLDFASHAGDYSSENYGSVGMAFTFENEAGFPFFGLSNGVNLQIADDEAVLSASTQLDKQVYNVGETKHVTVEITNTGDIPAENVVVHIFQSSIGRNFDLFERAQEIATIDVGTIANGTSITVTHDEEALSYLGYSPVFAVVEFDSDLGQEAAEVPDFLDLYSTDHVHFQAAGETHQFVMSTLSGALLVTPSGLQQPAIPEPRLEVADPVIVGTAPFDVDDTFTVEYLITNVGADDTEITLVQSYPRELVFVSGGVVGGEDASDLPSVALVDDVILNIGDSITIELTFKVTEIPASGTITLPPAGIEYNIAGESSLGDTVDTGFSLDLETVANFNFGMLGLSAGAAAQQQSQQSATQDSSASAYSASSSVGAGVGVGDVNTSSQEVNTEAGFIGPNPAELLGLMLIPLVGFGLKRKRNF